MKIVPFTLLFCIAVASPAPAATVERSYQYFPVHGRTLEAIETQLEKRGPELKSTGQRHPGATRMEFTTKLTYAQQSNRCRVANARVSVKATVILPRWRDRKRSAVPVRLIWDTLSSDIKRHEESHISIAKNHAHELEDALMAIYPTRSCETLAARVKSTTARILAEHDSAQARFDRVENINFDDRIMRLLRYRLQRMEGAPRPLVHR